MKRNRFLVGVALVLLLALIPLFTVQAGRTRKVYLDWREVVPEGSGNPNMFGEATVGASPGQGEFCYSLRVFIYASFEPPTGASIHEAPAGENGPLVIDLQPDFTSVSDTTASDCVPIGRALAHDIQKNPSDYYLLVTDVDHPDGGARAQLIK
jgi:hypothetical protein